MRFDRFTRGLYATDASIYQIEPAAVGFPRNAEQVRNALQVARDLDLSVVPRGAGTSMGGQAVGEGLVLDTCRHLGAILDFDPIARRIVVEPGVVLDDLNAFLRPHDLFFPIDVATSSRATIGGMAGNNSAGARSIRYGHMVEQVRGIEAVLADGASHWFAREEVGRGETDLDPGRAAWRPRGAPIPEPLRSALFALYSREAAELERCLPRVPRNVAGYALERLGLPDPSVADLLVGSEGTLAFFTAIALEVHPIPATRVLGVCRFPSVRSALAAVPAIVALDPTAVELIDHALLSLAREIDAFREPLARMIGSDPGAFASAPLPGALLLVEFSADDPALPADGLHALEEVVAGEGGGGVVRARDRNARDEVWAVRKAGLNIATSVKTRRKPIAFIEDCAIPIARLPEWYDRLTAVIERHETRAIWYAHASVGCLHVRPALDVRDETDVGRLRAIAEETFSIARDLGGTHSGEHGDGIVRSEFLEPLLGKRLVNAFEEIKDAFDPTGTLNPGRIVRPPRMDDRSLFRYGVGYRPRALPTVLDWSPWSGLAGAVEMCNNNGACRKRDPGVMCPSYRATRDERHSTRGRANALRLTLTGQLGEDAWDAPELYEAMDLCIGCKACRRECPTGVDLARMKIEYLARYRSHHALTARERVLAFLPRYAPWASRAHGLMNLRNRSRALARLSEHALGLAAQRDLPVWTRRPFRPESGPIHNGGNGPEVALFVDTFTRYFEPENAHAAARVLSAAGFRVIFPDAGDRPVCCGRTFLNVGLVDEAKTELDRLMTLLAPYAERGVRVVGLEPSCLLTLRDELPALRPGTAADAIAGHSKLLAELLDEDGLDRLPLVPVSTGAARLHGHCHEKAFGVDDASFRALNAVPGLVSERIPAGCCGMAGSFGYESEHVELSRRIGELGLLPHVRATPETTWIVANGTSCRHQIRELAGRETYHLARVLDRALQPASSIL